MGRALISDETKQRICELWNGGMTTSKIGDSLGITKNSVVGIVNRLRQAGYDLQQRGGGTFKVKKARPLVRRPEKKVKPVYGKPVDIMGLAFRSCRFIVESGDEKTTLYCNNRIYEKSFCREHHDLCYVPIKPKKISLKAYR